MKLIKKDIENNILVFEQELLNNETEFGDLSFTTLGYYFVQTSPTLDISASNIKNIKTRGLPAFNFKTPNAKKLKITIEIVK